MDMQESSEQEFYNDETLLEALTCEEILDKYQKSLKSNSIKLILSHFNDFMLQDGDQIVIESLNSDSKTKKISQIRKEFISFMKDKKFNQRTFLSIFKSQRFQKHFQYYLSYYSSDIIYQKNQKDAFSNAVVIHFFKRCFSIPKLINSMKLYKKNKDK
ncbi:hypothetical protein TTHERM_00770830 (macronuclear) [Tetrahymena thermophila SB210]|uniref:Uncharacterized protein n=1 Tax=Tetrahymena thermophila (strain SB210) TaxID=312017 RepID=Q23AR2_TETTS|nr:hypothetical protein TTHERM_00770830 [Tetrahymena thermophila SB210]EAR93630.1 hypothetical protein TTHERM_00770830 [Tetrahymena thermophila SB210]|eukprot:XP_001013875.1 hypothetical protein TTHERM_00770830 [Tetrahymena thermophila SB210]